MLTITNNKNNKFNVVIVLENDSYGLENCLTHDKAEPLVEFYDAEYVNSKGFDYRGQFIARYYSKTLRTIKQGSGLDLMGCEAKWKITEGNVTDVDIFIDQEVIRRGSQKIIKNIIKVIR